MAARDIAELVLESATDYAILTMDLAGIVTFWSKGAENILGWTAEEMLGRPGAIIFTPEDQSNGIPEMEMGSALSTGRGEDERWHHRKDGTRFWASGEMMVLQDGGAPEGFLKILRDRTAQRLADEQVMRERERLQQMFEQAPGFFAMLRGPDHVFEVVNSPYMQLIGHREVVGLPVRTALPEVVEQGFVDLLDRVYATGEAFVGSATPIDLQRHQDGRVERRVLDFVYQPVCGPDGAVDGIFVQGTDVTDRLRAEQMLREMTDALPVGVALIDHDQRYVFANPAAASAVNSTPAAMIGQSMREVLGEASYEARRSFIEQAFTGNAATFETQVGMFGEPEHVYAVQYLPRFSAGKQVEGVYIIVIDITDRKRAEALQNTVNHELSHRMKNQMAMVQSLVTQTLRTETDIHRARTLIMERIGVLSGAHDILVFGQGSQAPIHTLIENAISFARHSDRKQVFYSGPSLVIGSRAALSLTLLLHELTTNAIKYGALSTETGRLDVTWSIGQGEEGRVFTLNWQESAGPPVRPPERTGFGSRLIKGGIAGATSEVTIDYLPTGLRCTIEASFASMVAED